MDNMHSTWAPLQAIINMGPHYILENQSIWAGPISEFAMPCRIAEPIKAELDIFPQTDGLLITGGISGKIILPCNRCAEDALYEIKQTIEGFEPFPLEGGNGKVVPDSEVDEYFLRLSPLGVGLEVNLAALAWEEFAQSLPLQPLCRADCAGLCSICGQNLNLGACACAREESDARLVKLRDLKIEK